MKCNPLALAAAIAFSLPVHAEVASPSIRRPRIDPQRAPAVQDTLSTNYQITIAGSLGKSEPLDVILRGSDARFSATLENPNRHIDLALNEEGDRLTVKYTLGARMLVNDGKAYADTNVMGSFLVTLGEPFSILEVGDSKLTIQVDKLNPK